MEKRKLMSIWYIGSLIILLSLFWILGENFLLTNKVIVTTVTIILGLKFDLELTQKKIWFLQRFKKEFLNSLNMLVQAWALLLLLSDLPVVHTKGSENIRGIFILSLIGLVVFYPLFYFRVFKKTNSIALVIFDTVVMAISALFVFYNLGIGFLTSFVYLSSSATVSYLSLLASIFLIYPWYRYTSKKNQFNYHSNWKLN